LGRNGVKRGLDRVVRRLIGVGEMEIGVD